MNAFDIVVCELDINTGASTGFIYDHGALTRIKEPGAHNTYASSINDLGQVAGYASLPDASRPISSAPMEPSDMTRGQRRAPAPQDPEQPACCLWSPFVTMRRSASSGFQAVSGEAPPAGHPGWSARATCLALA